MTHWVYEFSGCPDTDAYQQFANEAEPGEILFRHRPGSPGIMDGFVRESVDDLMMVARFRWVASGEPSTVGPAGVGEAGARPNSPGGCVRSDRQQAGEPRRRKGRAGSL
ncbi:hypothetical protein ACFWII_23145 [Streptomyces sp. NPDC127063]|uniref:hypothetical protein n=1 Tax=Streptomyces sp. NPDC127063 TaxID=3347123 RepID=UPI00365880CC